MKLTLLETWRKDLMPSKWVALFVDRSGSLHDSLLLYCWFSWERAEKDVRSSLRCYLCCVKHNVSAVRKNANRPRRKIKRNVSEFHYFVFFIINIGNKGSTSSRRICVDICLLDFVSFRIMYIEKAAHQSTGIWKKENTNRSNQLQLPLEMARVTN